MKNHVEALYQNYSTYLTISVQGALLCWAWEDGVTPITFTPKGSFVKDILFVDM